MPRDEASQKQVDAARPARSTWLSANAGSGKTRVLTDRVARLLLEGTSPNHILCLTYTKAAANEMQNRLFDRLGEWAMLPDDKLTVALESLGYDRAIDADVLAGARRLFAQALETPGGLKIQTIHSFCAALLRRFPLEAGISPLFTEMEEHTAALLRGEVIQQIAQGPDAPVFYDLALQYTGEDYDRLTGEILRHRPVFDPAISDEEIYQIFGQPAGLNEADIAARVFLGGERDILAALIPALKASGANDVKAAKVLETITALDFHSLDMLEKVFLTGGGAKEPYSAKFGSFPTKPVRAANPDLIPELENWMRRVEAAREARLALEAIRKTRVLHRFARVFLPAYDAAKQMRGWLDFDDLILRARALLIRAEVAAWVLYKLDGGIDHILVDEAQDTSPVQWQVIERLAQEFTSGEGARADILRTIFVVGDKKQSIYSFQGADPREFDRMRKDFADQLGAGGPGLQEMEMEYSFRSSQAILSFVDACFEGAENSGFAATQKHKAFHADLPGRVDLWPLVPKPEKTELPDWHDPVDIRAPDDPNVELAKRIAGEIRAMIDRKQPIPDKGAAGGFRPVRPGDFLILVQRRKDLFHEIIRACKSLDLPIAGADRLRVGAELAVKDLAALLAFLSLAEDDLSLAAALKSPLFGWSEAQLYDLAHNRKEAYLWQALRTRRAEFNETCDILHDLRGRAEYLRPFDLIERILTRHDGRRKLLARLGPEAEDGIDALLSQAMEYERNNVDSLTGFLAWMETDDLEIKRQAGGRGDQIRVMTVHGAKGLEAPVVILPETGERKQNNSGQIMTHNGIALWSVNQNVAPGTITRARESQKAALMAERDRLLYVAMTRAEKWLIIAGAGDTGKGESWYEKAAAGMARMGGADFDSPAGPGRRHEVLDWPVMAERPEKTGGVPPASLPDYFMQNAPLRKPLKTISPSELSDDKALSGEHGLDEAAAKRRGTQIHRLLEFLPDMPQADWPDAARRLLGHGTDSASGDEFDLLFAEVEKVLTKPALSELFGKNSLAETGITANLAALGGRRIHGLIDRLIIGKDAILAVDYKSNAVIPEAPENCPAGLLAQMGAYAHALREIYPDRQITTALLWTRPATLMRLPHDLVSAALQATSLDALPPRT